MLKTETFAKLFFLLSCTGLLMYVVLAFYTFHTAYTSISQVQKYRERIQNNSTADALLEDRFTNDLKYILLWPIPNVTNKIIEDGQSVFINYNCTYINCYLASNKYLLNGDYRNFDAIILNASIFTSWDVKNIPDRRSTRQKFVFYSELPSDSAPMCNICAENYFNWTWTYKLSSDILRPLIEVRNMNNEIVAPRENVKWINNVMPSKLNTFEMGRVKKDVVCIINNCQKRNETIEYAKRLKAILDRKALVLDLFGCQFLKCSEDCLNEIKNKYHFYLVYEDSFAVDYVSAEVIKAYDSGAIPIMIGGADYQKFLPEGSYVKARNVTVHKLAETIEQIVENPSIYNSFHNWRQHYVIKRTRQLEGICDLCSNLNNKRIFKRKTAVRNFRHWWYYGSKYENCNIDPDPSVHTRAGLKESDLKSYYYGLKNKYRLESLED
ncbi:PREDICTED: alpha-(1,3)-fucosyltransferase C-like [Papilio polytes]|uniref:alpha-(1,3)-fucosyltransferase C-like n=1 Tax=Papilio polytes TaxID=76194 RepID=UPI000675CCE6|nr:PREDICTED: alpha-(1,3)-fucosyltransferase C-like [Papilio polytes]